MVSPSVIFDFPIMSVLLPKAGSLTIPKEYVERRINGRRILFIAINIQ
jgi:hypothetical protein